MSFKATVKLRERFFLLTCLLFCFFSPSVLMAETIALTYPELQIAAPFYPYPKGLGDAPRGGWLVNTQTTTPIHAVVTLPRSLSPGKYAVFFDVSDYDYHYNVIARLGGGQGITVTNSRDWNGHWTNRIQLTTTTSANVLDLEFPPSAGVVKALIRSIYITDDMQKVVMKDFVTNLDYPTVMDNSAPNKGNLIENSSFEAGIDGTWFQNFKTKSLASMVDSTIGMHGPSALRVSLDPSTIAMGRGMNLMSRVMHLKPNKKYTFSAYAKLLAPGFSPPFRLVMENAFHPEGEDLQALLDAGFKAPYSVVDSTCSLTTSWKRCSMSAYAISYPNADYVFKISSENNYVGAEIAIDAVQLEEGEFLTPYETSRPLEVGITLAPVGNIFYTSELPEGTLRVFNSSTSTQSKVLGYAIFDSLNRQVAAGSRPLSVAAGQSLSSPFPLATNSSGHFRLVYWLQDESGSDREISFSVVPPPVSSHSPQESMMGTHLEFSNLQFSLHKKLGFHWARALSPSAFFRWSEVLNADGSYDYYDAEVQRAVSNGFNILANIGGGDWPASAYIGTQKDYAKWTSFVRTMVRHYKGYVHYWEIWNEPMHAKDLFTTAEYAYICKLAVDVIRQEDPTATIVGIGGEPINVMPLILDEFKKQFPNWQWWLDMPILAEHSYVSGAALDGFKSAIIDRYTWTANDGSTKNVQVWNTESGTYDKGSYLGDFSNFSKWGENPFWPASDAEWFHAGLNDRPEGITKTFAQTVAYGLSKYFYYDSRLGIGPDFRKGHTTLQEYDGSIRAKGIALSIAAYFLDLSKAEGVQILNPQITAYLSSRSNGSNTAALWSTDGSNWSYTLPAAGCTSQAYDYMANRITPAAGTVPLGRAPVYIVATGCTPAAFKSALLNSVLTRRADTLSPNLSIVSGPRGPINSNSVRLRWQALDDTSAPGNSTLDREALTFKSIPNPLAITYSTMLSGPGRAAVWSDWSPAVIQDYANLPAGSYVFSVRAKDESNNLSTVQTRAFQVTTSLVKPGAPVNVSIQ